MRNREQLKPGKDTFSVPALECRIKKITFLSQISDPYIKMRVLNHFIVEALKTVGDDPGDTTCEKVVPHGRYCR